MKYFTRVFLFNTFSLWLSSALFPGLVVKGPVSVMLFSGFVLALLMILVMPILKIMFIPINIITFGLLSWLMNVVILYLLTIFVPDVMVRAWTFPGFTHQGFSLPSFFISYPFSLIISSVLITFIGNLLHEITE